MCDVHTVARRGAGAVMIHRAISLLPEMPRTLSVHGAHVMLMGMAAPLPATFPLTLTFAHGAPVKVAVTTRRP